MKFIYRLFCIIFVIANLIIAEGDVKSLKRIPDDKTFTQLNINNISTFAFNNGKTDQSVTGSSGFYFPKGNGKALVFASGLMWGAKINDVVKVGGSDFNSGLTPGRIKDDGTAEDPSGDDVRVFRVRRDFKDINNRNNIDISVEVNSGEGSEEAVRNLYIQDWNEWPVHKGAPYEDIDGDGNYNPSIDIPGIPGADQTVWYVANDLNPTFTFNHMGSPPIGIEFQATFWAYKSEGPANNIIFKKYLLINKSQDTLEEMYLSMFMDPDVGDASDDLVGIDTSLGLGFAYNSNFFDSFYGNFAPSIGFKLLQGPMVDGDATDKANFKGREISGKKNLNLSSLHYVFKCCPPNLGDPIIGSYEAGSLAWYNYMQGFLRNGDQFNVPSNFGSGQTKFPFSGDPVSGEGWIDGVDIPPGDRRLGLGLGPFEMAPGDSQEVIFAHIAAGGENGVNNLTAITLLKQYAEFSQFLYNSNFAVDSEMIAPLVTTSPGNQRIVLSWGDDLQRIDAVENYDKNTFTFQGYNVYQFANPGESLENAKRIATFDIVDGVGTIVGTYVDPTTGILLNEIKQYGTDSGLKRFISLDKDYINESALVNGKNYYFAVTSYAYSTETGLSNNTLESFPQIIEIRPKSVSPGVIENFTQLQNIPVTQTSGSGRGNVNVTVITPERLVASTYNISISKIDDEFNWLLSNNSSSNLVSNRSFTNYDGISINGLAIELNSYSQDSSFVDGDSFTFTVEGNSYNIDKAKQDVKNIKIFPNPYYYKIESTGLSKYPDYVTFSNLPQRATIRIVNLAGQFMKIIEKDSISQFLKWDLYSKWNNRVPSGLYLIYIELPDIGAVKVLKLLVV